MHIVSRIEVCMMLTHCMHNFDIISNSQKINVDLNGKIYDLNLSEKKKELSKINAKVLGSITIT